jgi:plasmid stabilization system protein ParE
MERKERVDFHPAATEELEVSAEWYAQRSPDAARGFAAEVDAALTKIESEPARFSFIDQRHQACGVERYPIQVVFRNDGTRIYIVAIAHAKRRPNYWNDRT